MESDQLGEDKRVGGSIHGAERRKWEKIRISLGTRYRKRQSEKRLIQKKGQVK